MMIGILASTGRICADCGAGDPDWASINRGVLICNECCYIHRTLGRHVSQLRSLSKGIWCHSQLELIQTLYDNGSNNVWEHLLIESQNQSKLKKKPNSNDPIIPKKEEFIKSKYAQMAYTIRLPKEDNPADALLDLNRQLWACVRTSRVETSLRLLALGADPNFADPGKANCPVHVAASENQILQVELLWIYGADVGQKNAAGLTASEIARAEGYIELASRLEELEFEVTDHFSMFLCGRKPDHSKGAHFLIPEMVAPLASNNKQFRKQLESTSCVLLEKLVQDVYDEVDRRETATQWNAAQRSFGFNEPKHIAVFLPPNPLLTATRNQLRQKLAKYDAREFSQMIIDLLKETRRRFLGISPSTDEDSSVLNTTVGSLQNATYDSVANDIEQRKSRGSNGTHNSSLNKSENGDKSQSQNLGPSLDDYLEMRERFDETDQKIHRLIQTNQQLTREMESLRGVIKELNSDRVSTQMMLKALQDSVNSLHRRHVSSPIHMSTLTNADNSAVENTRFLHKRGSVADVSSEGGRTPIDVNTPIELSRVATVFPENLIGETELLIVNIKRLLSRMNEPSSADSDVFSYAESIDFHIKRIIGCIPSNQLGLQKCIDEMREAMRMLYAKCSVSPLETSEIVHMCHEVASSAKALLVKAHENTSR